MAGVPIIRESLGAIDTMQMVCKSFVDGLGILQLILYFCQDAFRFNYSAHCSLCDGVI